MSECVVRMERPTERPCELWHNCNPYIKYSMKILDASMEHSPRPKPMCKGCRIIYQLPEGHGRLGDLDELKNWLVAQIAYYKKFDYGIICSTMVSAYETICEVIDSMMAIVPAEAERSEM